jgi:hypothetical protein
VGEALTLVGMGVVLAGLADVHAHGGSVWCFAVFCTVMIFVASLPEASDPEDIPP